MAKKAYFIGIAGKAMGPLAKAFKDADWKVTGSDQEKVYPPISVYLKENKLKYFKGYNIQNVPLDADLVVVGRGALMIDPKNPEYKVALERKYKVLSYPEVLRQYLIKENSIVVAGTYGKTTISAIIAWILISAGLNPSYMIGGIPLNLGDGVKITDSNYSVVEGDETPDLMPDGKAKFLFYRPKFLLITSTLFDHPEIYKTDRLYKNAFIKLVKQLPDDGRLVFNLDNVDGEIIENFIGKKISYSMENKAADIFIKKIFKNKDVTQFSIGGELDIELQTILIGKHNLENICGAVALCSKIGVENNVLTKAVRSFSGVKTRLELLGNFGGRLLYWDFAQHPAKVKGTLDALRWHYPQNRLFCVFDPAMTGLKYRESLEWYASAFDSADQVVVGKAGYLKANKDKKVTGRDIVEAIFKTQKNVFYEPLDDKLIDYLLNKTKKSDVIVFMSSGGLRFTDLIKEMINGLKN